MTTIQKHLELIAKVLNAAGQPNYTEGTIIYSGQMGSVQVKKINGELSYNFRCTDSQGAPFRAGASYKSLKDVAFAFLEELRPTRRPDNAELVKSILGECPLQR